jgi:hypothetical protein
MKLSSPLKLKLFLIFRGKEKTRYREKVTISGEGAF